MWVTTKGGKHINTDWFDKERQIDENRKEADERNILDIRGKDIKPLMPVSYKRTAQEYYQKVSYTLAGKDISRLDVNNIKEVVSTSLNLLRESGVKGNSSCYRVAAGIAAIFDRREIKYECFAGAAISNPRKVDIDNKHKLPANHVWIKANNKIYEYFEGQGSNIKHLNISDKVIFRKE